MGIFSLSLYVGSNIEYLSEFSDAITSKCLQHIGGFGCEEEEIGHTGIFGLPVELLLKIAKMYYFMTDLIGTAQPQKWTLGYPFYKL